MAAGKSMPSLRPRPPGRLRKIRVYIPFWIFYIESRNFSKGAV
jgi:hypothetical protein